MPIYKCEKGGYLVKVSYKDEGGRYKKLTRKNAETATKAGAMRVEARLQIELAKTPSEKLRDKEQSILEDMTFSDLVDDYTNYLSGKVRSSTRRQKEQSFRIYLIPYFGKYKINDFTPALIKGWKRQMDNYKSDRNGLPLTVSYKNTNMKALKSAMAYAAKYYGYANNAYKRVDNFSDTMSFNDNKDIHFWTFGSVYALF